MCIHMCANMYVDTCAVMRFRICANQRSGLSPKIVLYFFWSDLIITLAVSAGYCIPIVAAVVGSAVVVVAYNDFHTINER